MQDCDLPEGHVEGVQTLVVELPKGITSTNPIPHVTVALKGASKPVSSNWVLSAGWEPVTPFTLKARVGCVAGGQSEVVFSTLSWV